VQVDKFVWENIGKLFGGDFSGEFPEQNVPECPDPYATLE